MTDNPLFIEPQFIPLGVADVEDEAEEDETDSRETYLDEVEAAYTYYAESKSPKSHPRVGVWRAPGY